MVASAVKAKHAAGRPTVAPRSVKRFQRISICYGKASFWSLDVDSLLQGSHIAIWLHACVQLDPPYVDCFDLCFARNFLPCRHALRCQDHIDDVNDCEN
jgi:hypothetical protein